MNTEEAHKKSEELFPYKPTESSHITDGLRKAFLIGFGIGNEKMNNIIKLDKYPCIVNYSCDKLNCMKSLVEHKVTDDAVRKRLLELIEVVRSANTDLRDWGHELRRKLIKIYNIFDKEINDINN